MSIDNPYKTKQQVVFIVNPIAGGHKHIDWSRLIDKCVDLTKYAIEVHYTSARGDATNIALDSSRKGIDIVCVIGGDGTINEAAKALIGSNTVLAVVPRGSGNGFARHFSIPLDPTKALQKLNDAHIDCIDTGRLNNKLFLNIAGIGFDAHIAQAFDKFGERGLAGYAFLSLKNYFSFRPRCYTLKTQNKEIKTEAFLLAFANASQYGNNAIIAPEAIADDGLLNLIIIKSFPLYRIFDIMLKIFRGTIYKSPYYDSITFNHLEVKCSDTIAHIDGEPISIEDTITISVHPKSLKLLH